MRRGRVYSESTVSGNHANIPVTIRRELGIDDGDKLRWHIADDGTLHVQVVQQQSGTFSDFDGYDGDAATAIEGEHDGWGVNSE